MAVTRSWSETTPADSDNVSAGAGEIRNLRVDISERIGVENFLVSDSYSDIADVISAVGATPTTLILNDEITCTTDQTVPSTLTILKMASDGTINISVTKTLTVNGQVITSPGHNPYSGSGSVVQNTPRMDRLGTSIQPIGGTVSLVAVDGVAYFIIPSSLNGLNLVACNAKNITAGTGSATTIDIYNLTDTVDMLSSAISIAAGATLGDGGTIDTSNDDVVTGDILRIDVSSISSTTAPKGLIITAEFGKGSL